MSFANNHVQGSYPHHSPLKAGQESEFTSQKKQPGMMPEWWKGQKHLSNLRTLSLLTRFLRQAATGQEGDLEACIDEHPDGAGPHLCHHPKTQPVCVGGNDNRPRK